MANNSWLSNRDPVIHGVRHQSPPRIWQDGFPLGNGFLGAMLWGDGDPLNLTLDCADLWDSRTDDSYWKGNPAYTYAHLRELIAAERYDEAEIIFGTPSNAITPTKISFGRMAICTGPATAYDCRLDCAGGTVWTGTGWPGRAIPSYLKCSISSVPSLRARHSSPPAASPKQVATGQTTPAHAKIPKKIQP